MVLFIGFGFVSFGQTNYYVNDNSITGDVFCTAIGDAANLGTSSNTPQLTIQYIVDNYDLDPGDTIFVDVGNYSTGTSIGFYSSDEGDLTNDVVIYGAGNDKTIVTSSTEILFYFNNTSYFTIDNMKLVSSASSKQNLKVWESIGISITNCILINDTYLNITMTSEGNSFRDIKLAL